MKMRPIGTLVLVSLALVACGGSSAQETGTEEAKEANTFTVTGEAQDKWPCDSDTREIPAGTKVKILVDDKAVAMGTLQEGRDIPSEGYAHPEGWSYCVHPFTIEGVPAGEVVYSIVLGDFQGPEYSEAELRSTVSLSLTGD